MLSTGDEVEVRLHLLCPPTDGGGRGGRPVLAMWASTLYAFERADEGNWRKRVLKDECSLLPRSLMCAGVDLWRSFNKTGDAKAYLLLQDNMLRWGTYRSSLTHAAPSFGTRFAVERWRLPPIVVRPWWIEVVMSHLDRFCGRAGRRSPTPVDAQAWIRAQSGTRAFLGPPFRCSAFSTSPLEWREGDVAVRFSPTTLQSIVASCDCHPRSIIAITITNTTTGSTSTTTRRTTMRGLACAAMLAEQSIWEHHRLGSDTEQAIHPSVLLRRLPPELLNSNLP